MDSCSVFVKLIAPLEVKSFAKEYFIDFFGIDS